MNYAKLVWREGQPYSAEYEDIYYSKSGGSSESEYVFFKQNNLPERWLDVDRFTIAEIGFGTGLNFIITAKAWLETSAQDARLYYVGVEKHPVSPDDIRRLSDQLPELAEYFDELLNAYPLPIKGVHVLSLFGGRVQLHLHYFDIEVALRAQRLLVDAWYLDGFSPDKNPGLWSVEVFKLMAQNSKLGSTLSTYTCAGSVRRGLESAGFTVRKVKGHGLKREMIVAVINKVLPCISRLPWYDIPQSKVTKKEITVVGAGLAGLSAAWCFAQRGWRVTIIDKHKAVAQEASGNPAGLLLPRLSSDNELELSFYSNAYLFAIKALSVLQNVGDKKIWFSNAAALISKQGKIKSIIDKNDYPEDFLKPLSADEIPEFVNCIGSDMSIFENGGWASPAGICETLLRACSNKVNLVNADVKNVQRVGNEWSLIDEKGGLITSAEIVIVASGVGINAIEALAWMPVTSVRGQTTELTVTKKSALLDRPISFGSFITPQCNGVHYLGASYSLDETTEKLLEKDQQENFAKLEETLPGMFDYPTRLTGRVGFRAVSKDRMPMVGAVPDVTAFERDYKDLHHGRRSESYEAGQYLPNLYVTATHGSRGLCSCFLSAEILASMVENSPLPIGKDVADMLNPARFLIRDLKRNRSRDQ